MSSSRYDSFNEWWLNLPISVPLVEKFKVKGEWGERTWFLHKTYSESHRQSLIQDVLNYGGDELYAVMSKEAYQSCLIQDICSKLGDDYTDYIETIELPLDFYFFSYCYDDPKSDFDVILHKSLL